MQHYAVLTDLFTALNTLHLNLLIPLFMFLCKLIFNAQRSRRQKRLHLWPGYSWKQVIIAALVWCDNTGVLHVFETCNGSVTSVCAEVIMHLLLSAPCMMPFILLAVSIPKAPLIEIRGLQVV